VFRASLLLSTPIVAVAANLLRVLLMAVVVRAAGPQWIGGVYHEALGLFTFAAALGLFAAVGWWLTRVFPEPAEPSPGTNGPGSPTDPESKPALGRRMLVGLACLGLALLGQTALVAHVTAGAPALAPRLGPDALARTPHTVPVSQGAWTGVDLDPATLPSSTREYYEQADDKLCRNYTITAEGQTFSCQLWAVYFHNGLDRQHHPRICYQVAGQVEDPAGRDRLVVGAAEEPPIERFCYRGDGGRGYVYYWHYSLDPPPAPDASALQVLYQGARTRRPSITVEVFTGGRSPEELDAVAELVQAADRELRAVLPAGAHRDSAALPVRLTGAARGP
jgi:hypothetical protein